MHNNFPELAVGLFQIIRPRNCLAAAMLTLLGYYLGGRNILDASSIIASIVTYGIVASSNVYNDYCDVVTDRINQPQRPIPTGKVSKKIAYRYFLMLNILVILLATQLDYSLTIIAVILFILGVGYTSWFKDTILVGNLYVAFMSFTPILFGGKVAKNITTQHGFACILIFLLVFANEVLKSIWDEDGDGKTGIKTISTEWGIPIAIQTYQILALLFCFFSLAPWLLGFAQIKYLLAVIPLSILPLLFITILLRYKKTRNSIRISLWIMGVQWFSGMIVIALLKR